MLSQGIRAMERWGQVNRELGLIRPVEPHWYLAVLGVAPWAWRRGWGRALVEALGQLVARQPAPIYLEADRPQSVRFYQGLGFENRAEIDVLGVRCVCLGRGFPGVPVDLCDPVRVTAGQFLPQRDHCDPGGSE
jgi:hypothetical protein